MKRRRRRGPAAPQAEACDVWLDTAELKRSPAQSLLAKPRVSSGIPGRKLPSGALTQGRASQPRTKQTTIAAFFRTRTVEEDKENSRPPPFIPSKGCKGKGPCLAAAPVKILVLPQVEEAPKRSCRAGEELGQGTPRRCARAAPAPPTPVPDPWSLQEESHEESGAGENSQDFAQDSEGSRPAGHGPESDSLAGEAVSANGSVTSACRINKGAEEAEAGLDSQPRLGSSWSKAPHQPGGVNSSADLSGTPHTNPAVPRGSARAPCVHPPAPRGAARAQPLRERSRNGAGEGPGSPGPGSPCGQLFTQDSEGTRVIAHRAVPLPASPGRGGAGSQLGERPRGGCYELFTQDSEGNRVIKHW